jgi:hypothetical protein
MAVVKEIKDKTFAQRFKPDMPDGTLRHGAMLDYSVTQVKWCV